MFQYEDDERAVARVLAGLAEGEIIDHATAKVIALGYNDVHTAPFVSTGVIEVHTDDPAGYLMDSIKYGVDANTLWRESASLAALEAYLVDRVLNGDFGRVDGWVGMDIRRHVDYPHHDGQLDTCWCYCTCHEGDELDCPEHGA